MAETELTKALKTSIWNATKKQGVFGCYEVTIGWFGSERVDYLTYDTKGIFRCYEVKISKNDFHSKAKNTFIGNFNYYVMPLELFVQVEKEIPKHIGVYIGSENHSAYSKKKAIKQELKVDKDVLKDSMIRSMNRDVEKVMKEGNEFIIQIYKRNITELERERNRYREEYWEAKRKLQEHGIR
jgi:hypothetical protein